MGMILLGLALIAWWWAYHWVARCYQPGGRDLVRGAPVLLHTPNTSLLRRYMEQTRQRRQLDVEDDDLVQRRPRRWLATHAKCEAGRRQGLTLRP